MPYNVKSPSADLKKRIKKKYPNATAKDIRQFANIFNKSYEETKSEEKAFSRAWGVLRKKFKKESQEIFNSIAKLASLLEKDDLLEEAVELIRTSNKYFTQD